MSPAHTQRRFAIPHRLGLAALGFAVLATGFLLVRGRVAAQAAPANPAHGRMVMADGSTMAMPDWFATHPARGVSVDLVTVDSFLVGANLSNTFEKGVPSIIDTAHIQQGQVILWKWVSGSHTITNGTGSADPDVGSLFDVPSSSLFRTFSFQFDVPGTYPFFCRTHEVTNMRGVVVVSSAAGVDPIGPVALADGFVRPPAPNPARGSSSFSFSLSRPGRARAMVLDLSGRRVATILDQELSAGTFPARWDGRAADGSVAPAGVYLLQLELPGMRQTRRLTLVR